MRYILLILLSLCMVIACKKATNNTPDTDSRLPRLYCNDPEAVNYNWNFPGTPDNTTCVYPTEVFSSAYTYPDSVYFSDGTFLFTKAYTLQVHTLDKIRLSLFGFCPGSTDSLTLTANRFYHADLDTAHD